MIVSEIFYGVKCNRCKEQFEDGEHSFWNDEDNAVENAIESEWIEENGRHYCTKCYEYNEEKDENYPKKNFPEYVTKLKSFIDKILKSYSSTISEKDDNFQISTGIYQGISFEKFEENYIKDLLGDKLISLEYQKHKRYTRYNCVILVKRDVSEAIT